MWNASLFPPSKTEPRPHRVTNVKAPSIRRAWRLSHISIYPGWPLILYYASLIKRKNPSDGAWPMLAVLPSLLTLCYCWPEQWSALLVRFAISSHYSYPLSSKGRKLWTLMCNQNIYKNKSCRMTFEGAFPTPVTMALSPSSSNPAPPSPNLKLSTCCWCVYGNKRFQNWWFVYSILLYFILSGHMTLDCCEGTCFAMMAAHVL